MKHLVILLGLPIRRRGIMSYGFVNEPIIIKPMKRYYIGDYVITRLNDVLQKQYDCKYLVTINGDIVFFSNTLKEAKRLVSSQLKEVNYE
jgi:hypothetical protein